MRFFWLCLFGMVLACAIAQAGKVNYSIYGSCTSDSMWPTFSCGDQLVVNTVTSSDEIEVDSVYCYRPDTRVFSLPWYYYICHRLTRIDGKAYYFQGDNNMFEDEPVERRFIAWKVVNF